MPDSFVGVVLVLLLGTWSLLLEAFAYTLVVFAISERFVFMFRKWRAQPIRAALLTSSA